MPLSQPFCRLALVIVSRGGVSSSHALLTKLPEYRIRGPIITFNSLCLIAGFAMLGFSNQVAVRYIGVYLATGAYVPNWAALNGYQANNITGSVLFLLWRVS